MGEQQFTILCFGDSNTWGYIPATGDRYPKSVRWTGRLQELLGTGFDVIAEGLNGRAAVFADPISGRSAAQPYFSQCLDSHAPLDLVIIMLGTNDMKSLYGLSPYHIAEGVGALVKTIQASAAVSGVSSPHILVVAPPPITELVDHRTGMFAGAIEKSQHLEDEYRRVCAELSVPLIPTAGLIASSPIDGLHLEPEAHEKLAEILAQQVRTLTAAP